MGAARHNAVARRGEGMTLSRRALLRNVALGGAGLALVANASPDPWSFAGDLLQRILPPRIPRVDFPITRYGAKAGADASTAIRRAIDACHRKGGGRIVVPVGEFFTGAVHLKSRVELHVQAGATLRFSQDPAQYPVVFTRWEGVELMNYSPLVYAF